MNDLPFITVDKTACVHCHRCAAVCPNEVFAFEENEIVVKHKGRCIHCGHCVAVCEQRAFAHGDIRRSFVPLDSDTITPDALQRLFERRRTCRAFQEKTVAESDFTALLQAASRAPSATNAQNVRFLRLDRSSDIEQLTRDTATYYLRLVRRLSNPLLRHLYRITVGRRTVDTYLYHLPVIKERFEAIQRGDRSLFYGAPMVLVAIASGLPHIASANVNLAVMLMMLKAETLGLGTLFNGYALTALRRDTGLRRKMGICAGYWPSAVLAVGYPACEYQKVPPRRIPRVIRPFDNT